MHPRVMKVQQNGHKCHAAIPSQKSENSKNLINFFSHSQLQYKPCGLITDCYFVTLPIHSHVTLPIHSEQNQLVSCDVLGQVFANTQHCRAKCT